MVKAVLYVACALFLWSAWAEQVCEVPSALSYLQRIGVVKGAEHLTVANELFSEARVFCEAKDEPSVVELTRPCESNEVVRLLQQTPVVLCAGQGNAAVVYGRSNSEGGPQMFVFGHGGLVATCRYEGVGSNGVYSVECRMSSEVRDMMLNEGCARRLPSRLLGLDLDCRKPELALLVEDKSEVRLGMMPCSVPRCKEAQAIRINHPVFTDMLRGFEKESGRMISLELRRVVGSDEDISAILNKIWMRLLPLAGFYGGRVVEYGSGTRVFEFKRIDDIRGSLLVSESAKGCAFISLTLQLPEDFEVRNSDDRRRNGWRDPRIMEF